MQITHDLAIGGLQQVVVNICRTIDRNRFDISVLCLRELGEFLPDVEQLGIKVFYLPPQKNATDYLVFLKVAKLLKKEKIDIVHTHNTQPFTDGGLGAILAGVKTIVHTDHARDFPDKKRYMFAEWFMSHFAYKVVGVSDHTADNLIRYERISPKKVMTIPNGIEGSRYRVALNRDQKRHSLGLNKIGPIIGLGVRLSEQKGIKYLLHAMPTLISQFPDISLVIAGKGELEGELKALSADLGITGNVFFLGPRLDMPELLQLFDLYVLPSLWEGMPMVLLEAMAAGCPIVATDVGGNPSVITHKISGSLVPSKNATALALEIINVLSGAELRHRYITNSLKTFNEKFSAGIMTREYEALYLNNA